MCCFPVPHHTTTREHCHQLPCCAASVSSGQAQGYQSPPACGRKQAAPGGERWRAGANRPEEAPSPGRHGPDNGSEQRIGEALRPSAPTNSKRPVAWLFAVGGMLLPHAAGAAGPAAPSGPAAHTGLPGQQPSAAQRPSGPAAAGARGAARNAWAVGSRGREDLRRLYKSDSKWNKLLLTSESCARCTHQSIARAAPQIMLPQRNQSEICAAAAARARGWKNLYRRTVRRVCPLRSITRQIHLAKPAEILQPRAESGARCTLWAGASIYAAPASPQLARGAPTAMPFDRNIEHSIARRARRSARPLSPHCQPTFRGARTGPRARRPACLGK